MERLFVTLIPDVQMCSVHSRQYLNVHGKINESFHHHVTFMKTLVLMYNGEHNEMLYPARWTLWKVMRTVCVCWEVMCLISNNQLVYPTKLINVQFNKIKKKLRDTRYRPIS